jgi:hypothetical protein
MSRKSIKRTQPWTISLAYGPNGESRYYVGPYGEPQDIKFPSIANAKRYVNDAIWHALWAEVDSGAKWLRDIDIIPSSMRMNQIAENAWLVFPTIDRTPKNIRFTGKNVQSYYMVRLPLSTRWIRVKADWTENSVAYFVMELNPSTMEKQRISIT